MAYIRKDESVAAPSYVISNLEEIGRAVIDKEDIEMDPHDVSPRGIALEYLVTKYVHNNSDIFDVSKPAASDGERHVTYIANDGDD